jgi:predicted acylesterase/phospholipase RssA
MPEAGQPKPFDIGLVMAGAISAGAYTAGVCDFLIQALDAWEAAKADPTVRVPRHRVRIKALAGASAGAMTSAIAAVALGCELDPVADPSSPPPGERNRFYDAWVRQIDISKLLDVRDIKKNKVVSVLDATALEEIASAALRAPHRPRRAYVEDPLPVLLTVANLRGVPYGFALYGGDSERRYGMLEHMDHMRFAVGRDGQAQPGECRLDPAEAPGGTWPKLVQAALASGAFPGGLAPRRLTNERAAYAKRHGRGPLWDGAGKPVEFLSVDGGLMDNEPLELVRRLLCGTDPINPREGELAHRGVVMIDPFPNDAVFVDPREIKDSLIQVAMQMFGALMNQARFKPEELALAEREGVFSRYMIAPSRPGASEAPDGTPAMASAIMGGFGGFFHESFRQHDFQLGRRNCQAFLKWHFALPVTNTRVFDPRERAILEEFRVRDPGGDQMFESETHGPVPFAPIIPLVGSAAVEVPAPELPSRRAIDMKVLESQVRKRVKTVGGALIAEDLKPLVGGVVRATLGAAWSLRYAGNVTDKLMKKIDEQLARLP